MGRIPEGRRHKCRRPGGYRKRRNPLQLKHQLVSQHSAQSTGAPLLTIAEQGANQPLQGDGSLPRCRFTCGRSVIECSLRPEASKAFHSDGMFGVDVSGTVEGIWGTVEGIYPALLPRKLHTLGQYHWDKLRDLPVVLWVCRYLMAAYLLGVLATS